MIPSNSQDPKILQTFQNPEILNTLKPSTPSNLQNPQNLQKIIAPLIDEIMSAL